MLGSFDEFTIAIFMYGTVASLVFIVFKAIKHSFVQKLIAEIKKKLLYSSILRPLIQYYLASVIIGLRKAYMLANGDLPVSFGEILIQIKLAVLVVMPV